MNSCQDEVDISVEISMNPLHLCIDWYVNLSVSLLATAQAMADATTYQTDMEKSLIFDFDP